MTTKKRQDTLQLLSYRFNDIVFKGTGHTAEAKGTRPVEDVFSREITKIDEDEFEYTLKCDLRDTEKEMTPYVFHAEIIGRFRLTNWESEKYRYEREVVCASTLFPILRAFAATVTINTNTEPLVFGLISASDWLNIVTNEDARANSTEEEK